MTRDNIAVNVRRAQRADSAELVRLIDALAIYEKLEPPDAAAKKRLIEDTFGPRPRIEIMLAEAVTDATNKVVGYAIVLETYSSFLALPTLYLEDIFVDPDFRGAGAGFQLFREVVRLADERGCGRVDFVVLDWNTPAREFYKRLGAQWSKNWLNYRLTREQFNGVLG